MRVPSLKTNSSGYDWAGGSVPGTTIPIDQFYIAKAGVDTAATINNQLAAGKNLILTPGIYGLNDTIRVTRANTIVLGMGLATLQPTTGLAAMTVGHRAVENLPDGKADQVGGNSELHLRGRTVQLPRNVGQ